MRPAVWQTLAPLAEVGGGESRAWGIRVPVKALSGRTAAWGIALGLVLRSLSRFNQGNLCYGSVGESPSALGSTLGNRETQRRPYRCRGSRHWGLWPVTFLALLRAREACGSSEPCALG